MPWLPGVAIPSDKANDTVQFNDHPIHHNTLAEAIEWLMGGGSPFVDPRSFGAPANGIDDDSEFILAAYEALVPGQILHLNGALRITQEIVMDRDDTHVLLTKGSVLDATALSGVGTLGIHDTQRVLAAIHVMGDRVKVGIDGEIYSALVDSTIDGMNRIGVLVNGATSVTVAGSGRIHSTAISVKTGFYCGLWAGGGATDLLVDGIEIDQCYRNILMGYSSQAGIQVRGWTLKDVNSHHSRNDAIKLTSSVVEGRMIGGHYCYAVADGLDGYVGGQQFTAIGVLFTDNGNHGAECKYSNPLASTISTGETGVHGYNDFFEFQNCRFLRNAIEGIAVDVSIRTDAGVTEENYPYGVKGVRISDCEIAYNHAVGARLNLGPGSGVTGGTIHHNGLGGGLLSQPAGLGGIRFESGKDIDFNGTHVFDNCGAGVTIASKASLSTNVPNRQMTIENVHARNTQPARLVTDGAIVSGSNIFTSELADLRFVEDTGATIVIPSAGSGGPPGDLSTTILKVLAPDRAQLATTASATVSAANATIGTVDRSPRTVTDAAMSSAINADHVTSNDANFDVSLDTGAAVTVASAYGGALLSAYILQVVSDSEAILSDTATSTVSGVVMTIDRRPQTYGFVMDQITHSDVSRNISRNHRSTDWLVVGYPIVQGGGPSPLSTNYVAFLQNRGRGQPANTDILLETLHIYQPRVFSNVPAASGAGAPGQYAIDVIIPGLRANSDVVLCSPNGSFSTGLTLDWWVQADDILRLALWNETTGIIAGGTRYIHILIWRFAVPT